MEARDRNRENRRVRRRDLGRKIEIPFFYCPVFLKYENNSLKNSKKQIEIPTTLPQRCRAQFAEVTEIFNRPNFSQCHPISFFSQLPSELIGYVNYT
jgi:hypothetical protein